MGDWREAWHADAAKSTIRSLALTIVVSFAYVFLVLHIIIINVRILYR